MKKIMGTVIVGLFGFSLDAMCGYEPLKEENNDQHPKSGSASSKPKHEDPIIKRLQAAYPKKILQELQARMQQDYEEQQAEEEAKRRADAAFQEVVERLRAQKESRDSPRIKAH